MQTLTQNEVDFILPFARQRIATYHKMLETPSIPDKPRLKKKFLNPLQDAMTKMQSGASTTKWQKSILHGCIKEQSDTIEKTQEPIFKSVLEKLYVLLK